MNGEEELAKMRKSIGRMKIAIAILFMVAIALGYFRFAPKNDWKLMKSGQEILRINLQTEEAYVLTPEGWECIAKEKCEENKSSKWKRNNEYENKCGSDKSSVKNKPKKQRKLYDADYSKMSDDELMKRFDILENGTIKK